MPVEPKRKTAMISSTSLDLPEHRQHAMDACLRQGSPPTRHGASSGERRSALQDAIAYRWRWWTKPISTSVSSPGVTATSRIGHDIAITEMEFKRADERSIPILVFTMHDDHPVIIDDG